MTDFVLTLMDFALKMMGFALKPMTGTGSGYSEYSGSPRSGSGYSEACSGSPNSGYSGSGYSGYTGSYSGYSSYSGCSGYSGYSGYCGESDYTEFASDGAEIRSISYLLKRIAEEAELDDTQRRTDMAIVQVARTKFALPYAPLTMKEEVLRIAEHLGWDIVMDEDRNAAIEKAAAYDKQRRGAVKNSLKQLRGLLVRQDKLKEEQLQMEILESTDTGKKKAAAIEAMVAASKLPGRNGVAAVPTSPRAVLTLARERLAMPSKNIHKLKFDELLREAQQVCHSYGIVLDLPETPHSEGETAARSGSSESAAGDGASVAPSSSTEVESMDSTKLSRNKLQDRIDGAIGTSNLDCAACHH